MRRARQETSVLNINICSFPAKLLPQERNTEIKNIVYNIYVCDCNHQLIFLTCTLHYTFRYKECLCIIVISHRKRILHENRHKQML